MKQPRFSVIIPTYHEEAAIGRTLSSIERACNSHSIETIIVDAGSTDRTREVAGSYTNNIHILEKRGIALARNYGASIAKGDVLVFLDSDTVVPERFFDELSQAFGRRKVCGVNCNVMPSPHSLPKRRERIFYSLWSKARNVFYRIRACGTGENGIIVRKDTFDKTGGFDESMNTMEDLDFVFRASKQGKFIFLDNLTLTESMRRLRDFGLLKFSRLYIYNFLYYLVKRKPRLSRWDTVR